MLASSAIICSTILVILSLAIFAENAIIQIRTRMLLSLFPAKSFHTLKRVQDTRYKRENMSHIFVRSERIVDAKPEEVYDALTDYKNKRPRMLTPNFLDYIVEKGGQGDG